MICRSCQEIRWENRFNPDLYLGPRDLTFGAWAIHQIAHLDERQHTSYLQFLVHRVGILDAKKEGDVIFWRLDFWNGKQRAEYRRLKLEGKIP